MLFALLLTFLPLVWALRAIFDLVYYSPGFITFALFSYVLTPAVNGLPFLWALRAKISFGLLFPLLLNVCPPLMWALRVILVSLLTFFPIHRLRQRFWACGLFCFDFVYLFGFCHFILVFICHSPYLGFIK